MSTSFRILKESLVILYAGLHIQLIQMGTVTFVKQQKTKKITSSKMLMCAKRKQFSFVRSAEIANVSQSVLEAVLSSII